MMKHSPRSAKIYLGILLAMMYLPIVIVIIFSFNESEMSTIWTGFTFDWYKKVFESRDLLEALSNSVVLAVLSCAGAAVIGTLGAVGMTRSAMRSAGDGKKRPIEHVNGIVEYVSTLPIMIPEIILGMVFMVFFSLLGLKFGMLTLVIAHTAFCIPYVFMIVKARLVGMDPALVEAARDLGASEFRAFWDVTPPLITPGILSGMLLAFAMSLDDVVISIFVTGARTVTLPVKIYTQIKTGITPEINALCTLMLIVTVGLVFLSGLFGRRTKD